MLKTPKSKAQELLRVFGAEYAVHIVDVIVNLEGYGKWLMIPNNQDIQFIEYWRNVLKEIENELNK